MPKRKNNAVWITPIIFSAIIGLCVLFSGVAGHWDEWWVKFVLIPSFLVGCAFAIYEFLIIQIKKCRKILAVLIAALAFILMGIGVFVAYKVTDETVAPVEAKSIGWQPPELPPGCSNVTVWFGTLRIDMPR